MSILGCGKKGAASAGVLSAALIALPGCVSIQALEPVISPPGVYQRDNRVMVEFVSPAMVGIRCAERGARFLGMPGVNAGACGDEHLITMANPCLTLTAGWYAEVLCHELAHANGWPSDHPDGLLFAHHEPVRPASESPEAIALAAAQASQASAQRATLQLASAAPSEFEVMPIRPLMTTIVTLESRGMLTGEGRVAERPARPVEAETGSPAPDVIQVASAPPIGLRGSSGGPSRTLASRRLALSPNNLGFGPALPEPLP